MAAIDRVVHHSVILDLMAVESYRAQIAAAQHRPGRQGISTAGASTATRKEEHEMPDG